MALLLLMCSCNPTRQASRKLQRAERLIERAKQLDPSIVTTDTIIVKDTLIVEAVRVDSTFIDIGDTVTIENDRLVIRYKRDTITNRVFIEGECKADTIIREVRVPVEHYIYSETWLEKLGIRKTWQKITFWLMIGISLLIILISLLLSFWKKIKPL